MKKQKTAALLIIGNEILSGRTQDKNLNYIAKKLIEIGVNFCEARVVADIEDEIVKAVNELRNKYDYIFTTGGIGPTHDDITTDSVSKAFGVKTIRNQQAEELLIEYYSDRESDLNDSRLRMANTPDGAELIYNPLTAAPGYKIDNVFVLAGVPSIMKVMFDFALQHLENGPVILSASISCDLLEGDIAEKLGVIQENFPETEIGSYPFIHNGKFAVSVVIRSVDINAINRAKQEVLNLIEGESGEIISEG